MSLNYLGTPETEPHDQCDQIGRCLRVLSDAKVAQIFGDFMMGYFEKHHF